MTVAMDYYMVLNVARTSSEAQIAEAVKSGMRQRKRAEASDPSLRQEAENKRPVDPGGRCHVC